jgi:hypothetical protein
MTPSIPDSYEASRTRFRARADFIRTRWPAARLTSQSLPYGDDLTIDWIFADAGLYGSSTAVQTEKERLLIISTAQHGIEGYVGSALLELFIDEYLSRFDPQTTGLLLIHAINPWGMKHWKRTNPNNVDLNRNFVSGEFAALAQTNPDYPRLASYLSPKKALGNLTLEKFLFFDQTMHQLVLFGPRRVREAALMGQYTDPKGIYFGGQELQPEVRILMDLYRSTYRGYKNIVHLDMHTGYGPRYQMTLVTSPHEKMSAAETTAKYGIPLVAGANPDEFYTMQGDMIDWEYNLVEKEFSGAHYFGAVCEFGSFGESILAGARSLRITIFKNQLSQFGADKTSAEWVNQEYRELYRPAEFAWFDKAQADVRQAFDGVLSAEGFLQPK